MNALAVAWNAQRNMLGMASVEYPEHELAQALIEATNRVRASGASS